MLFGRGSRGEAREQRRVAALSHLPSDSLYHVGALAWGFCNPLDRALVRSELPLFQFLACKQCEQK